MVQSVDAEQVPVFILCGGLGTRIKEETEFRPKPMVPIGDRPVLWHVMQCYARHGFRRFVLCLGFKADVIRDYFANIHLHNADCTIKLKTNEVKVHEHRLDLDWEVTLAYTGEANMTGSRIAQATRKYLGEAEHFAATYGDGLTDGTELLLHRTDDQDPDTDDDGMGDGGEVGMNFDPLTSNDYVAVWISAVNGGRP